MALIIAPKKEVKINTPCTFNSIDLGIDLGSAVSTASNYKVDTRVMYSAGKAAVSLKLLKLLLTSTLFFDHFTNIN